MRVRNDRIRLLLAWTIAVAAAISVILNQQSEPQYEQDALRFLLVLLSLGLSLVTTALTTSLAPAGLALLGLVGGSVAASAAAPGAGYHNWDSIRSATLSVVCMVAASVSIFTRLRTSEDRDSVVRNLLGGQVLILLLGLVQCSS